MLDQGTTIEKKPRQKAKKANSEKKIVVPVKKAKKALSTPAKSAVAPKKAKVSKPAKKEASLSVTPPQAVAGIFDEFDGMVAPDVNQLKVIEASINVWAQNEEKIMGLEELLKTLKQEQHMICTKVVPDAMAAAGTEKFKTSQGVSVEIKDFLNGSLPKDPFGRKLALDWVDENNGGDIIKSRVVLEFGKGENEREAKLAQLLRREGFEFDQKRDIHAQTYCAFVRDILKDGKKVPLEELGLYAGRAAKIKLPKMKLTKFDQPEAI